jgi:hypothetical protein
LRPARIRDFEMQKFNWLTFIEPALSYIDSGKLFRKPFGWLYMALAAVNAVLPFYLLYKMIDTGVLKHAPTKFVFAFIFAWLFVVAACWVGLQIWWNRKDKVQETSQEGAEFPVTPVIAHFVQTFGEWFGAFVAIVGFGISLFGLLFLGNAASELGYYFSMPFSFASIGFWGMILSPVQGFLIIIVFRYLAELFRAFAAIANNTKK